MKVCVVGAGAIGGLLGGRLAGAGCEVALVARGAHLRALQESGLELRTGDRVETFRLAAAEDPAALGRQDVVFIALKSHTIGPMLPRLAPLLAPDTAVVTAINGLPWWYFEGEGGAHAGRRIECLDPDGAMARALDPAHLVGCVVHASAEVLAPGIVQHTSGRGFIIGEIDGRRTARIERLANALADAGLEPAISERIRDDIWTKLIGNLSYNPVAALTGALMNEINDNPALIALITRVMIEGIAVGEAYGARFTVDIPQRLGMARKLGAAKISMLQDFEKGRQLELDAIVTAVSELGRKAGVPTPTIDGIEALIRERVKHTLPR